MAANRESADPEAYNLIVKAQRTEGYHNDSPEIFICIWERPFDVEGVS